LIGSRNVQGLKDSGAAILDVHDVGQVVTTYIAERSTTFSARWLGKIAGQFGRAKQATVGCSRVME
jgi:hypothetical protein